MIYLRNRQNSILILFFLKINNIQNDNNPDINVQRLLNEGRLSWLVKGTCLMML